MSQVIDLSAYRSSVRNHSSRLFSLAEVHAEIERDIDKYLNEPEDFGYTLDLEDECDRDTERPPPVEAPRRMLWEPCRVLKQKWEQVVA